MPSNANTSIIDEICEYALSVAAEVPWLNEPLTRGRGKAYLLQHIPRNRLYSGVTRPAWLSRCPDLAVVRKTISQMREELVFDDRIAQPHTSILWQMGRNIGLTDEQMNNVRGKTAVGNIKWDGDNQFTFTPKTSAATNLLEQTMLFRRKVTP